MGKSSTPQGNKILGRIHLRKECHRFDFEIAFIEIAKKAGIPDKQRYIVEIGANGQIIANPM